MTPANWAFTKVFSLWKRSVSTSWSYPAFVWSYTCWLTLPLAFRAVTRSSSVLVLARLMRVVFSCVWSMRTSIVPFCTREPTST